MLPSSVLVFIVSSTQFNSYIIMATLLPQSLNLLWVFFFFFFFAFQSEVITSMPLRVSTDWVRHSGTAVKMSSVMCASAGTGATGPAGKSELAYWEERRWLFICVPKCLKLLDQLQLCRTLAWAAKVREIKCLLHPVHWRIMKESGVGLSQKLNFWGIQGRIDYLFDCQRPNWYSTRNDWCWKN